MLLVVLFPIVDSRRFLNHVERLGIPEWPFPNADSEFVRFFGAIRDRTSGGIPSWIGEDKVCNANRAISFTRSFKFAEENVRTRIAFRRFYFDGWAVGKFEVGIHASKIIQPCLDPQITQLEDIGRQFLRVHVRIGNSLGLPVVCELAQAGKHLANLYLVASTSTKQVISDLDKWQVRSGAPLLFVEFNRNERIRVPSNAKPMKLPAQLSGINLFHYSVPYRGGNVHMWILQVDSGREKEARSMRLHLLRLHAEHESLRQVLQNIAKKDIQVTRGTTQSDDLQLYLYKAIKRITHFEGQTDNINKEIAKIARQSINTIRPGQLDILLEAVDDYRRYLRKNIEIYAKQDASTINNYFLEIHNMENKQGTTYNLSNFQAGILNIENIMNEVIQSVSNIPNIDQSSKDEIRQLIKQLNVALQKAPLDKVEEAEAVADTAKNLVEDVSKAKPNKAKIQITLEGLKQASENIAKILPDVLPIVVRIIAVVTKLFGFT